MKYKIYDNIINIIYEFDIREHFIDKMIELISFYEGSSKVIEINEYEVIIENE